MHAGRRLTAVLALVIVTLACANASARTASRYGLPRDVPLPSTATVAVYVPANVLEGTIFVRNPGYSVDTGKAVRASIAEALGTFVTGGFVVDATRDSTAAAAANKPFGLLLALQPRMQFEGTNLRQTLKYKVIGPANAVLLQGEQSVIVDLSTTGIEEGVHEAMTKLLRQVFPDILVKLRPDAGNFPASLQFANVPAALVIDHDNPIASGTGFFVNAAGDVMTAAHVMRNCLQVDVKRDTQVFPATVRASSDLLDLAVIATGTPTTAFLRFRKDGEINLGEPVTNVGFPLQSILAASPNLTRGNVSSRGALAGSAGQFQFSAPIQPGSSGGPVVSDGGEVLGIAVSTLNVNVNRLIETGALPQNVNFALDARYATMFLARHQIDFTTVPTSTTGSMTTANQAALSTVVSLTCFQ